MLIKAASSTCNMNCLPPSLAPENAEASFAIATDRSLLSGLELEVLHSVKRQGQLFGAVAKTPLEKPASFIRVPDF